MAKSIVFKENKNKNNNKKQLCLTCAFLAGEGEMVVAGHVIPLAVLVPDHHHTVLSRLEETVWLVGTPVLILLQTNKSHTLIIISKV